MRVMGGVRSGGERGAKKALRGLIWLWWLVAAGLLALRWVNLGGVIPMLQSGLPLVGMSLLVLLVLVAVMRHKLLVVMTVLLLVPMVVLARPWWFPGDQQPSAADDIVVVASNMEFGAADVGDVERLVIEKQADALVLLEITPEALVRIEASGIPEMLSHRSGRPRDDAGGTLIFTKEAHEQLSDVPGAVFDQVAVEVERPSAEPWVLLGAHPVPPTAPSWAAELADLRAWRDRQDDEIPLVMAGDFNASSAHPSFRGLERGMTDAQRATGPGWVRTWPQGSSLPAFVDLDHVLFRGFGVVTSGVSVIGNTDHAAVWARLG